jgi:hypothetical protein
MRPLYLHVGLHKTGTSYLQRLLLENRDLLLAAGLGLGPYQDPVSGTHHPILAALEEEGPEAVLDRVAEAPGARVLVSAEDLSWVLRSRDRAAAIRDAARRRFDPHVVIFLRRQDFLKESVYAEIVKGWFAGDILGDTHYDYDHAGRVAALEEVFGADRVHVALYHDPGPNDIVGTLLAATATDLDPARLRPVPPQNVSMGRRKALFLGQIPKPADAWADRRAWMMPNFVARVVAASDAIADDGERFLMSPRRRHDLVAAHLAGNRALVERRGLEPRGFLDLPDPDAPWEPPAPITDREAAAVRRACLLACLRRRNPVASLRQGAQVARLLAGRRPPAAPDPGRPDPGRPARPAES